MLGNVQGADFFFLEPFKISDNAEHLLCTTSRRRVIKIVFRYNLIQATLTGTICYRTFISYTNAKKKLLFVYFMQDFMSKRQAYIFGDMSRKVTYIWNQIYLFLHSK